MLAFNNVRRIMINCYKHNYTLFYSEMKLINIKLKSH